MRGRQLGKGAGNRPVVVAHGQLNARHRGAQAEAGGTDALAHVIVVPHQRAQIPPPHHGGAGPAPLTLQPRDQLADGGRWIQLILDGPKERLGLGLLATAAVIDGGVQQLFSDGNKALCASIR